MTRRQTSTAALLRAMADADHRRHDLGLQIERLAWKAQSHGHALPNDVTRLKLALYDESLRACKASWLWSQLQIRGVPLPSAGLSPDDLMALASEPGLTDTTLVAGLHNGADSSEILQAHRLQLPPSWSSLGRCLLEERARTLAAAHPTETDISAPQRAADILQRLRSAHSVAQVASAAHQTRAELMPSPLTPRSPGTSWAQRTARAARSSGIVHLRRPVGSGLAAAFEPALADMAEQQKPCSSRMSAALMAARDADGAHARFVRIDLRQPAELPLALQEATAAFERLIARLDELSSEHDDTSSPTAHAQLLSLRARAGQTGQHLENFSTLAWPLLKRLPERLPLAPLAGDLLALQQPSGPDTDYQLHGLLAGWTASDILLAHEARWPAWTMDWGPSPAAVGPLLPEATAAMQRLIDQLQLPQ